MSNVEITVNLPQDVAAELAQFVKRTGWTDARAKTTSDHAAYLVMDGIDAIMRALAEQGHDPR